LPARDAGPKEQLCEQTGTAGRARTATRQASKERQRPPSPRMLERQPQQHPPQPQLRKTMPSPREQAQQRPAQPAEPLLAQLPEPKEEVQQVVVVAAAVLDKKEVQQVVVAAAVALDKKEVQQVVAAAVDVVVDRGCRASPGKKRPQQQEEAPGKSEEESLQRVDVVEEEKKRPQESNAQEVPPTVASNSESTATTPASSEKPTSTPQSQSSWEMSRSVAEIRENLARCFKQQQQHQRPTTTATTTATTSGSSHHTRAASLPPQGQRSLHPAGLEQHQLLQLLEKELVPLNSESRLGITTPDYISAPGPGHQESAATSAHTPLEVDQESSPLTCQGGDLDGCPLEHVKALTQELEADSPGSGDREQVQSMLSPEDDGLLLRTAPRSESRGGFLQLGRSAPERIRTGLHQSTFQDAPEARGLRRALFGDAQRTRTDAASRSVSAASRRLRRLSSPGHLPPVALEDLSESSQLRLLTDGHSRTRSHRTPSPAEPSYCSSSAYPECGHVPPMSLLPAYALWGQKRPPRQQIGSQPTQQVQQSTSQRPAQERNERSLRSRAGDEERDELGSTSASRGAVEELRRCGFGSRSRSSSGAGETRTPPGTAALKLPPLIPSKGSNSVLGSKATAAVAARTQVAVHALGLRGRQGRTAALRDPTW